MLGKKRPKFETSDSLSDAAKSLSPPKKKGEKRVRSTRVGSGSVQKKRGSPPVWPHSRDHELEKMLRRTRKATDSECNDEHREHADRRHTLSQFSEEETRESRRAAVVDRLSTTQSFLLWKRMTRMISPRDTVLSVTTGRNSDLGPAWTSSETRFNLLSEGQLYLYGINVIKKSVGPDAGIYLSDQSGVRFPIRMVGKQFRVPVGLVRDGVVKKAEFIVDGGCPHHIISDQDASRLQGGEGELELTLGSFSEGQRHTLHGGNNWYVSLLDELGTWRAPKTKIAPAPGPVTDSELATFLVEARTCINDAWHEPSNHVLTTLSDEKGGKTKKSS